MVEVIEALRWCFHTRRYGRREQWATDRQFEQEASQGKLKMLCWHACLCKLLQGYLEHKILYGYVIGICNQKSNLLHNTLSKIWHSLITSLLIQIGDLQVQNVNRSNGGDLNVNPSRLVTS